MRELASIYICIIMLKGSSFGNIEIGETRICWNCIFKYIVKEK